MPVHARIACDGAEALLSVRVEVHRAQVDQADVDAHRLQEEGAGRERDVAGAEEVSVEAIEVGPSSGSSAAASLRMRMSRRTSAYDVAQKLGMSVVTCTGF